MYDEEEQTTETETTEDTGPSNEPNDGDAVNEQDVDVKNEEVGNQFSHQRYLIIGNSGSGKTTLAWFIARRSPYCLFINPQHANLPQFKETGVGNWKKDLVEQKHVQIKCPPGFDMEEFMTDWYEWCKADGKKIEEQITLAVDEISLFGVKGKLSSPPWSVTAISRMRALCNVILCTHSTYQIPNYYFNNMSYIIFMRTGQAKAEQQYLDKWFTGAEQYREILGKKYYYIIYDVNEDQYQPMNPLVLS